MAAAPTGAGPGEPRARGNAFFVARDFAAAEAAYTEGLSSARLDKEERAALLGNRAACHLELG
ncbi:hypothetical protein TSOC_015215, partial [Tetrabaena socialis]